MERSYLLDPVCFGIPPYPLFPATPSSWWQQATVPTEMLNHWYNPEHVLYSNLQKGRIMLYLGHQGGHVVPRGDVGAGGDEDVGVGVVRVPDSLGHLQILSIPTLSSHNSVSCMMDFYLVLSKYCSTFSAQRVWEVGFSKIINFIIELKSTLLFWKD